MKNALYSLLMIFLALSCVQAQNQTTESPNDQVIVKKITIKNIDGKETRTETVDTFKAGEWDDKSIKDEDVEIIIKEGDDVHVLPEEEHNYYYINQEQFRNNWNQALQEKELMKVTPPNKAVLGVQLNNVDGNNGAQIIEVIEGSAAEKAGLEEGDILMSVDGKETHNVEEVIESLSDNKPGDQVKITYLRGTKVKTVKAKLQERKEEKLSMKSCTPTPGCMPLMKCCKPGEWKNCIKNNKHLDEKVKLEIEQALKESGVNESKGEGNKKIIIINKKPGEFKGLKNKGTGSNDVELRSTESNELMRKEEIARSKDNQSLNVEYLTASPNPSNGQMKIRFAGPAVPTTIMVLDLNGKEVYNEKLNDFDGTYHKDIDIKNEAKGTLILKIIQGDKVMTQKIIVE